MKIFSFNADPEAFLPEKPRPLLRFGCGDDETGATQLTEQQQRLEDTARRADAKITLAQKNVEAIFDKPVSAVQLYDLTAEAHRKTEIMATSAKDLSSKYDDMKGELAEAEKKLASLLKMARILRDDPLKTPNVQAPLQPGSWWSQEYKKAIIVPYIYTKRLLASEVGRRATFTNIANIPSGALNYALDQAAEVLKGAKEAGAKVLGIPTWVIPVAIGTIAVGYITNTAMQAKSLMGAKTT